MGKYLYMAVTSDKYELPLVVEDSAAELANKLGIDAMSVYHSIGCSGKIAGRKIVRIRS
ncbi:hypothetical protein [Clostridium beijerinckii]|uniref:hypothetical protein n=1 Tax=Clostridium beijerinckii TaxID=1520 RepID=UPI0003D3709C|nr:hypothetical protein [Clostridium beijerinckii]